MKTSENWKNRQGSFRNVQVDWGLCDGEETNKNHRKRIHHAYENKCSAAIGKNGNSRATGSDGFITKHIKQLSRLGINFLTHLYDLSYNYADLSSMWETGIIVPLIKPKKSAEHGSRYSAISLLCPAVKVLNRILSRQLTFIPLAPILHGFRSNKSYTTALLPSHTRSHTVSTKPVHHSAQW